jgi:hypothetical protein
MRAPTEAATKKAPLDLSLKSYSDSKLAAPKGNHLKQRHLPRPT